MRHKILDSTLEVNSQKIVFASKTNCHGSMKKVLSKKDLYKSPKSKTPKAPKL